MPYAYEDLPASPYGSDWSVGAMLGSIGVIWVGDIPLDQARVLVDQGWNVIGAPLPPIAASAEPAVPLPPPEPPPQLEPPPGPPPGPLPEPINDPVIEPRTPITPQPLPPVGEPTLPPEPILPQTPSTPTPPFVDEPPPFEIPPVFGIGAGEIIIGIGGLLWPSPIEPDYGDTVPMPNIPPPDVTFPPLPESALPEPYIPPFDFPEAPDVIVVTPSSTLPNPRPSPNPSPINQPDWSKFPWPIIRPRPSKRLQPAPRTFSPPLPTAPPLPSVPPLPIAPPVTPPLPISPPLPSTPVTAQPGLPPAVPSVQPAPLTPPQEAGVESPDGQTCETPQQTKERRERKRENCRKLVKIHVKAHWKRVCVSEAIEHEAKRYRKKLVRKYITKPAGKLGTAAADWLLKETGLTPYADQAKDIKKRVSDLTKRQKRYYYEVPGTHIKIDPVDLIPKGKP